MSASVDLGRLPRTVSVEQQDGRTVLRYIDQRLLPGELKEVVTADWLQIVDAIKVLGVRGAPAIGVAGAAACAVWAADPATSMDDFDDAMERIANARPTAVNLRWAVERACAAAREAGAIDAARQGDRAPLAQVLFQEAVAISREDEAANRAMGAYGAELIEPGSRMLTHCNAGSLATSFYGTALGVIYAAAEQGKIAHVYADETRPLGQGARLTSWELAQAGVPVTVICDNMSASLMAAGKVDAVVVGADRITRNGDTANKIGTYGVAVLAKHHGIPFYVAAPTSTVDLSLADGSLIPIEERSADEVLPQSIPGVRVWNPAFDVTPADLITAIITERGVFAPADLAAGLGE
ncbi:MAG: S-methyl-5-thioribose-1-phosphate isomerase [Coriobacteriia bacterium]|nr:S-methyl-5-thioribose-1-phosphate isomerase [Coriobacteriia bacterium]